MDIAQFICMVRNIQTLCLADELSEHSFKILARQFVRSFGPQAADAYATPWILNSPGDHAVPTFL